MRYLNCANRIESNGIPEILISLLDLSPSMDDNDWPPSRKAAAVKANFELIEAKAKHYPQDKVGLIGFSGNAKVLHSPVSLGGGTEALRNALNNIGDGSGTNFTAALELAEKCLFSVQTEARDNLILRMFAKLLYETDKQSDTYFSPKHNCADIVKRIILLSDGEHNQGGSPVKVASRLKNAGVIIDCIGIASPTNIDEKLLKKIASRNPDGSVRYYFIGDQQKLLKKYQSLAHHIRPV